MDAFNTNMRTLLRLLQSWMHVNQQRVASVAEVRQSRTKPIPAGRQRSSPGGHTQSLESQMGALLGQEEAHERSVEQVLFWGVGWG